MRRLGAISSLHVQADLLTRTGDYDPTDILDVDEIRLTADGAVGRHEGRWIIDSHHRAHPGRERRWNARRALSMGFTGHYRTMADVFRPIRLGDAGENLIVDVDGMVTKDDLRPGLCIETHNGPVHFADAAIAEPCVPFTCFMLGQRDLSDEEAAADREKLRRGVRGFVMSPALVDGVAVFRVGDEVFVAS